MSGKRNVSVCRGHELANALYIAQTNIQWLTVCCPRHCGLIKFACQCQCNGKMSRKSQSGAVVKYPPTYMKLDVKEGSFKYWNEIHDEAFTIDFFDEACKKRVMQFNRFIQMTMYIESQIKLSLLKIKAFCADYNARQKDFTERVKPPLHQGTARTNYRSNVNDVNKFFFIYRDFTSCSTWKYHFQYLFIFIIYPLYIGHVRCA